MSTKSGCLIILLASFILSSLGGAESDFDSLSKQLFADDAKVLDKGQVVELLRKFRPLASDTPKDESDVTKKEVDELLAVSELSEKRCTSYNKYFLTYIGLEARDLARKTADWNENIKEYIKDCELEQFKDCAERFRLAVVQVSPDDEQLIEELMRSVPSRSLEKEEVGQVIRSLIESKLPQRESGSELSVEMRAHVELELKRSLLNLIDSCDRMNELAAPLFSVVGSAYRRVKNHFKLEGDLKNWFEKASLCRNFMLFSSPELMKKILDEVMEKY